MTKTLKNILLSFFVALFVGTCAFFCLSETVNAQENKFGPLTNKEYEFKEDRRIATDISGETLGLGFELKEITTKYDDLNKYEKSGHYDWYGRLKESQFRYTLTLCRDVSETEFEEVGKIVLNFYYTDSGMNLMILSHAYSQVEGFIDTAKFEQNIKTEHIDTVKEAFKRQYNRNGVKYINSGSVVDDDFMDKSLIIDVRVPSAYESYFLKLEYDFKLCDFTGVFKTTYKWSKHDPIFSPSFSVYDVLVELEKVTPGFENFSYKEKALDILNNAEEKKVTIAYLENIPNTPFATKKEEVVSIPISGNGPAVEDVCVAMGKNTLDVHDSYIYDFEKVTETRYVAHYLKNSFFRAVTEDGKTHDYYLDINKSYCDMYYPLVEAGIMDEGLYEFQFTRIIEKYPAMRNLKFNELYGTWGFAVLPEVQTLNKAWTSLFDIENSFVGTVGMFSYQDSLSRSGYEKLLTDFEYSWLDKVWSWFTGNTTGQFYVFWTEPGTRFATIKEGGAEEGKSVVAQEVSRSAQKIGSATSTVFDVGVQTTIDVTQSIGQIAKGTSKGINGLFGSGLTSILVIAGVVVVIITLRKNKGRRKK